MALTIEDIKAIKEVIHEALVPITKDLRTLRQDVRTLRQDVQTLQQDVRTLQQDVRTNILSQSHNRRYMSG